MKRNAPLAERMSLRWPWLLLVLISLFAAALLWYERQLAAAEIPSLAVTFSAPAGAYDEDLQLSLQVVDPQAEIYFTLDGSMPDPATAALYNGPLPLLASTPQAVVIRARSFLPDGTGGPVASETYFMGLDTELPMLSIVVDPEDFWGETRGIYVNHWQRGRDWERPVEITYVDSDRERGFQVGAGIRIHGGWSRYFSNKKSLRLYFRDLYGAPKLEYPLFGAEGQVAFDHLVLHNSSRDLLLFKNQLVDRLSEQMGGFQTRSQPALLFINGRPWGIYQVRERIDRRLVQQNFGVPSADVTDTPNNRGMQSAEQLAVDTVHWENFIRFVEESDLSDPANYAFLQTQIDLENFVDYYLLNMYVGNTDWPHHNVQQFRPRTQGGRWEWLVWDNDFAFERVDRQMVDHVLNVENELGQRMEMLINKLLANPEFKNLFVTRAADHLNNTLATPNVEDNLADLVAELEADISFEKERWDVVENWEDVVAQMHTYAQQRPGIMREHMVQTLGLPGTAEIVFDQAEGETGWLVVNDSVPQNLPWQGTYFVDSVIRLRAVPPAGYGFSGWEGVPEGVDSLDNPLMLRVDEARHIAPRFTPLTDDAARAGDVAITTVHVDDTGDIEGDWFDLRVQQEGGVDLRGWRLSDNDSIEATDEGSLILGDDALLADLATGSTLRIVSTATARNDAAFPEDGWQNGVLVLYVGNGRIDARSDPFFNLGTRDNLVLLAPGPALDRSEDIPVALWSSSAAVTPATFGLPPE